MFWNNKIVQNILINLILYVTTSFGKEFKIYWNIPTFMCRRYNLPIENVTQQFGIFHNLNDDFRGNHISILYDPGDFPGILKNLTTKKYVYRNHGVPQEGDLENHLTKFELDVEKLIPNRNFSGIAVIDFELWRPIYRQNFGSLKLYKDLSTFIERQRHPFWDEHRIDTEAGRRFEKSAREFILETLLHAKKLRPKAKWGYYGLPFCFNGRGNHIEDCPNYVKKENDGMQWLIDESDIVLPSVYLNEDLPSENRVPMIQGRVKEAIRMAKQVKNKENPKVYVYHRYVFADSRRYLSEIEELDALNAIKRSEADGIILWGSSSDLNNKDKCKKFYNYLINTLGPVVESLKPTSYLVKSSNSIENN